MKLDTGLYSFCIISVLTWTLSCDQFLFYQNEIRHCLVISVRCISMKLGTGLWLLSVVTFEIRHCLVTSLHCISMKLDTVLWPVSIASVWNYTLACDRSPLYQYEIRHWLVTSLHCISMKLDTGLWPSALYKFEIRYWLVIISAVKWIPGFCDDSFSHNTGLYNELSTC